MIARLFIAENQFVHGALCHHKERLESCGFRNVRFQAVTAHRRRSYSCGDDSCAPRFSDIEATLTFPVSDRPIVYTEQPAWRCETHHWAREGAAFASTFVAQFRAQKQSIDDALAPERELRLLLLYILF